MRYDNDLFYAFRQLAITSKKNLVIGETYYSNSYPEQFTIKKLLTNKERYKIVGLDYEESDKDKINWIVTKEDGYIMNLSDNNIGESYNPWLIFKEEEIAKICKEKLNKTIEYDKYYEDYSEEDYFEEDYLS